MKRDFFSFYKEREPQSSQDKVPKSTAFPFLPVAQLRAGRLWREKVQDPTRPLVCMRRLGLRGEFSLRHECGPGPQRETQNSPPPALPALPALTQGLPDTGHLRRLPRGWE